MAERAHPEDPGFRSPNSPYRKKLLERYAFCNRFVADKCVIDIPCGTGWGTSLLQGHRRVVGIDISQEAIDYAQTHFSSPTTVFRTGDMAQIPVSDNVADIILCLEGFEHVPRSTGEQFLRESKRVLVRGGLLVMTCPVLDENGKVTPNPYHVCEYPEEELVALLNGLFRIISLERIPGPDGPEYRAMLLNIKDKRYGT
jgi:ubiquinone/menaquinone biosynthesis C-methylase UbiE